ncbi:MAG: DUF1653 domain-containing protein [Lachnospiraceae bacterium]|jgi:hypothetical protein|nr:DUF1653 domain-containing protein [Lachnospiraceae bacterium]
MENREPKPGEQYRHFKGKRYRIVTLAEDAETGEQEVVYQALYGDGKVWVRNLSEFTEKLDRSVYPAATQEYRFEREEPAEGSAGPEEAVRHGSGDGASAAAAADSSAVTAPEEGTSGLDPLVEEFLDAGSTAEKLNILSALHSRITDDMIDTMAMASGLEIDRGDLESRWGDLRECLLTIEKYEQSRDRYNS